MINRHEWLKAVNKTSVLPRAKSVAVALWSFGNDESGLINPSLGSLCEASGLTEDTARRALADLEKAGWLARTVGRGQGVRSVYVLLSPGNVVALRPASAARQTAEKAADKAADKVARTPEIRSHGCKVKGKTKGSTGAALRSHRCNSLYKDEQTSEQKKGARPAPHLSVIVEAGGWKALEWNKWLSDLGTGVQLRDLTALHVKGGYDLPWSTPPKRHAETQCRIAMNIIEWAKGQGHAHAA